MEKGMQYIMNTYSRFPLKLVRGEGTYVYDENGKKYLDFAAGIAVTSLGHANKKLTEAIKSQAEKLLHISNLYWNEPQITLAEKLVKNSAFDKVFFCNSGAESVEAALKLARKYASKSGSGKYEIIAMNNSFHGRTLGAITATGQKKYREGLAPLLPGIIHAEFNDIKSLEALITDKTCAVLLEPVQGESGIHPADKDYLVKVRELCNQNNLLLIFDEVQCGAGRCGSLFAHEIYGVYPDIAVMAKGLAGGVPIGAMLATEKAAQGFKPGDHASTFGGNPLATAAANVVMDELTGGLLSNVKKQGEYLTLKLKELAAKHKCITEVRGLGLMLGIELNVPAKDIVAKCIENGLLLVSAGERVIRFVPPLTVSKEEIDELAGILDSSI
ncbi:MAG: aspartate aminotransferase family protein [Clostridiales bacterium]|jgi:predicted acetylornithine/succinylornithine family transaminase|nr:aspartate aminotransferase family protein [Clostridiales bacterium]